MPTEPPVDTRVGLTSSDYAYDAVLGRTLLKEDLAELEKLRAENRDLRGFLGVMLVLNGGKVRMTREFIRDIVPREASIEIIANETEYALRLIRAE